MEIYTINNYIIYCEKKTTIEHENYFAINNASIIKSSIISHGNNLNHEHKKFKIGFNFSGKVYKSNIIMIEN